MTSPECEEAIKDVQSQGQALLKFLSANDCDATGAHQYGILLPKGGEAWRLFTPDPPIKGSNKKHQVQVTWQDGISRPSVVTWYGANTRSEYRLTRFGKDFPFRIPALVGALFTLIPVDGLKEFKAYVLESEEDIEELQAQLGLAVIDWALYPSGVGPAETEDECLDRVIGEFAAATTEMPTGEVMSAKAREFLKECVYALELKPPDERFIRWVRAEDRLFFTVERKVWTPEVTRLFKDIDDFLATARRITQARASRAGRALENHMDHLLNEAGIPHKMRPPPVGGTRPDILIPGNAEYEDPEFPDSKLFMVASKRTCKERWTQVLREAPRIKTKHILTIQEGVAPSQMEEMKKSNVVLVVPKSLHSKYAGTEILTDLGSFVDTVRRALA